MTSDGGGLLLREVENRRRIVDRLAGCFHDQRDPRYIEFSVKQLVAQRVFSLALGYEDLNDHDRLRYDPLLALLSGVEDVLGRRRTRDRDQGAGLAGKSTLNRLELRPERAEEASRYHKIAHDPQSIDRLLVEVFMESFDQPPTQVILDLDATDDPIHGQQEGRFFHGYYDCYCYLPLYIFSGDFPLCARLRPSNIDAAEGVLEELEPIVRQLQSRWPQVRILIRGDSGFARDYLMSWCEQNGLDYVLGLARNPRLQKALQKAMKKSRRQYLRTGRPSRVFKGFSYRTLDSWSRARRVIGKAEYLEKGENPRFVVTSLSSAEYRAEVLYTEVYCARGEMENRIKEQQLDLFADRTSTSKMRSNQLRLYFSTVAYLLMSELRRLGLSGTEMARAYAGTIRTKILKIGASILVSVRRILFRCSSAYPYQTLFEGVLHRIQRAPP